MRNASLSTFILCSHTPLPRQNIFYISLIPLAVHSKRIVGNQPSFPAFSHNQNLCRPPNWECSRGFCYYFVVKPDVANQKVVISLGLFCHKYHGFFIPTRQNKSQSKQFCIGDLTLFGLIWSQLSISHRVSDFLLSKFYQGVIANGLENRVQASCHQSSLQFYHKVEQDASCKAKRYVSRVILRAVVQDSYCGHSRFQLRHSDHAM